MQAEEGTIVTRSFPIPGPSLTLPTATAQMRRDSSRVPPVQKEKCGLSWLREDTEVVDQV